ncbi:IS66 Orf2 family protein [Leptonema illini DSM 21528]|uniref:IS66 Orf2 family protein n=1 Tax=Leptonema illini DSM 21528 TaxID=929563 RepID=H2CGP6_9LEPT|nr:IS66 family insertion sequence element accessory protein TnpB [Leptonema illini]EHQ04722.1 IS66 Orf2 family protein [Leptonema illini DSM 21528]
MIPTLSQSVRIFLRPGATDMRKSINGLGGIVQNDLRLNPYEQSLFVFGNRRKDLVKILYWDRNGFCLWQKRLERDRFPWPQDEQAVMEITSDQLNWLLNGIDFRRAHSTLHYTKFG